MGESENEYRTLGAVYVILGCCFGVYFLLNPGIRRVLFGYWLSVPSGAYLGFILISVFVFVMVIIPFVLVLFGIVLMVRSDVWVARVSGILCIFSLICYVGVMIYPLTIMSG